MHGEVDSSELANLFEKLGEGDPQASEKLLTLLYVELHQIAQGCMTRQPPGHTLQATALVHEAYLKLLTTREERWRDRTHFLALAARAMRCVLVDHARLRNRVKRTGPGERMALDEVVVCYEERAVDLPALDFALKRLAQFDEPMSRAIEMRFFGGMEMEEIANFLGLSKRTLERQWSATRAWLLKELS